MGIDCNTKELEHLWTLYSHYPVISTIEKEMTIDYFKDYKYISLGEVLSYALLKYKKADRKNYVIRELDKLFRNLNAARLVIDNIDILFNPQYHIDILGYFVQLGRNRKTIVLWPGEYDSGYLSYASPEYEDYKRYMTKDYDVICLI